MGRKAKIDDTTLLAIARAVFSKRGASGKTKEIAELAGISEATIFKRFSTKSNLFIKAMLPEDTNVEAIVDFEAIDARSALISSSRNLLRYFRKVVPTAIQLSAHPDDSVQDVAAHFKPKDIPSISNNFVALIEKYKQSGEIKREVTPASVHLLIAAIHSLAVYEMLKLHGEGTFEDNIAPFVDALLLGLQPVSSTQETSKGKHI